MSVKMVDLGRHNEGDEDEKRPLLPPVQETYKKGNCILVPHYQIVYTIIQRGKTGRESLETRWSCGC